jgi:ATP-binding cassette subfamily B protein
MHFGFYDRVQSGQLISRANSDIRSVQMFLSFAPTVVMSVVMFFAALLLMLQVHAGLALVAVSLMPGVYFTGVRMRSLMFPVSWIVSSRQADVATIVEENVTGTRVVKSFAQEKAQIAELAKAAERLQWAGFKQVDVQARYSPFIQNLPRLGLAVVLLYGGWLAIQGEVTVGTLLEFNAYVVMLQMPFMMLGFMMMMAQRAAASAVRILEVLDEKTQIVDRPDAVDLLEPEGDVLFDHVTFGYADGPDVLSDFHLHMAPGETVALVGRTGSGKSTAARLLPRFYDVSDGAVRIDGHDVRDLTVESVRAHIGLVLDEPFLFSETIRANIAYGRPDATQEEIDAVARAAGALEFIERLPHGYDTEVGERGYTLSGGQRQRIAIARTLLVNPRILILDDATSSIDVHVEHGIHGALRTLMKGRTTLIIAHRLSTISLADRVVLLEGGRIVADGTHAQLMRTVPAYAEVLARAEEEWQEAHKPPPDPEEAMPPRMRAMRKVMQARAESREEMGSGMPGMPTGGVQ